MDIPDIYRRVLPSSCVDLASPTGIRLFKNALSQDNCNIYFRLASQFTTQAEPAYCGLSTLVMVLNALSVDPGRVWKAPWRWYHESMLDCCLPLEKVKKSGTTFAQFICLARCNQLTVTANYANESSVMEFREVLKESVKSDYHILVASYNREVLDQTGTGHFSPLAAYDEESDKVLIMDVARFKYPPHWVKVDLLFKAMDTIDPDTGKSRGFCLLKIKANAQAVRPLTLDNRLADPKCPSWQAVRQWIDFIKETPNDNMQLDEMLKQFVAIFHNFNNIVCARPTDVNVKSDGSCCSSKDNQHLKTKLIEFDHCCKEALKAISDTDIHQALASKMVNNCNALMQTIQFLTFPYHHFVDGDRNTVAALVRARVSQTTQHMGTCVHDELSLLTCQMTELLKLNSLL